MSNDFDAFSWLTGMAEESAAKSDGSPWTTSWCFSKCAELIQEQGSKLSSCQRAIQDAIHSLEANRTPSVESLREALNNG